MDTVAAHEELEGDLKKLGVEIKPSYNLEPPLEWNPTLFPNRKWLAGTVRGNGCVGFEPSIGSSETCVALLKGSG